MRIKSQQFPNNVWVSSVTWASAYAEGSDMYPEVQEQSKIIKKTSVSMANNIRNEKGKEMS